MELIDVLHILRRRAVMIVLVVVGCLAGAALATSQQTRVYKTSSRLIVSGASSVSAVDELSRRQLAIERAVAYSQIATTPPAVQAALTKAQQGSTGFSSSGGPSVTSFATGTDPFLTVTVTDTDPRRAAAVANAYVTVLPAVIKQLENTPNPVQSQLSPLNVAGVPSSPYTPKPLRNELIALAVGLVLGLGAAFVRESLDRRLRDSEEVETAAGVTVLGVVPNEVSDSRIPVETHPMSARAEAYRKVRTNLTFTSADGMPRTVLITSSTSGEGKTTLATNLALACARTGHKVIIVDADLRRPMVSDYLGIPSDEGLTNILTGRATIDSVAVPFLETGVDVITSGPIPANPSELLGSSRMTTLLAELEDAYDVVIVDAPPVLPVADALVLAVFVQAVVLVAKVGETTRDRLRRSKEAVQKVGGNLVGVVPNNVVQREDSAYAYAYRYRARDGKDGLELYTKGARLPEIDDVGRPLGEQPDPRARSRKSKRRPKATGTDKPDAARGSDGQGLEDERWQEESLSATSASDR